jgi:hypothetical protein
MENVDCEKLLREMQECVKENDGSQCCKEIIENFNKVCIKNEDDVLQEDEIITEYDAIIEDEVITEEEYVSTKDEVITEELEKIFLE